MIEVGSDLYVWGGAQSRARLLKVERITPGGWLIAGGWQFVANRGPGTTYSARGISRYARLATDEDRKAVAHQEDQERVWSKVARFDSAARRTAVTALSPGDLSTLDFLMSEALALFEEATK